VYKQYLRGGQSNHGLDRNEFLLKRAQLSSDPTKLMAIMTNYMFGLSSSYHIPHLKNQEVFGSAKWPIDCPPDVDNDFHHPDRVNFFRPQVTVPTTQPNVVQNVNMQQLPCGSNACSPLVSRDGLELKANICVEGKWQIECCPPSFVVRCLHSRKLRGLNAKQKSTFTNM
jgi:hypothetical protein